MPTVSFTALTDCTPEDYKLLEQETLDDIRDLPGRIMEGLRELEQQQGCLQVTRLDHSLQSATRAYNDGRDEEYVVTALVHDIGDAIAPLSHGELVAALIRPFVSERLVWIIRKHGVFQAFYYAGAGGADPLAREAFKDHPYYADTIEFCEKYDQNCFDPAYESLPLEFFEPMVRRVFVASDRALAYEEGQS